MDNRPRQGAYPCLAQREVQVVYGSKRTAASPGDGLAQVYNITAHIDNHPGWECACGISTVLAIMGALGTNCSAEFDEVHPTNGDGRRQLPGFYIGDLVEGQVTHS